MIEEKKNFIKVSNAAFIALSKDIPIKEVYELSEPAEFVQDSVTMNFTCKRVVVNQPAIDKLFRDMWTNDEWFLEVLHYLQRKHPKAAKKRRVWNKWCHRAARAAYGKNYGEVPKYLKVGEITYETPTGERKTVR